MEPKKQKKRIVLEGDVPSPINPPSGCRFQPRCPWAQPVCKAEPPRSLSIAGHMVRCHAVEKEQLGAGGYELPKHRTLPQSAG
jgi:oligopeptide/dipeptide ABC transporter ATP-binding protein